MKTYIGIDIAKLKFDVSTPQGHFTFENEKTGFQRFLKHIETFENPHCVCESTGGYELPLILFLSKNKIAVSLENPTKVKHFLRSMGNLAKTDKADAEGLMSYGQRMNPREWIAPSKVMLKMHSLMRRREGLIKMLKLEKIFFKMEKDRCILKDIESHIKVLEKKIEKFEAEVEKLIEGDEKLKQRQDKIIGINGFGRISAMSLICYLPELGSLSREKVVALAGLAPYNRDSGQKSGKRYIQGGRALLREKLYMPTSNAMRTNKIIREFAQRLRSRGKAYKVIVIACMRKMLIHLNAQLKYL